jgi:aerobic C4-dicarboxylate transport protein
MVVPSVPVAGLALILGIDRFMSEARALTNIIGNGVATIVIARWEGALNQPRLAAELAAGPSATPQELVAPAPLKAERPYSSVQATARTSNDSR